jgi:hypothetical protein
LDATCPVAPDEADKDCKLCPDDRCNPPGPACQSHSAKGIVVPSVDPAGQKYLERPHPRRRSRHETPDVLLSDLVALAVDAMAARMARGEDRWTVVVDIIHTVFGSGSGAEQPDRVACAGSGRDERARAIVADPEVVGRIVREVLDILAR